MRASKTVDSRSQPLDFHEGIRIEKTINSHCIILYSVPVHSDVQMWIDNYNTCRKIVVYVKHRLGIRIMHGKAIPFLEMREMALFTVRARFYSAISSVLNKVHPPSIYHSSLPITHTPIHLLPLLVSLARRQWRVHYHAMNRNQWKNHFRLLCSPMFFSLCPSDCLW